MVGWTQGSVNPDEYLVFKPLLNKEREDGGGMYNPIIKRHMGEKAIKMIYSKDPVRNKKLKNIKPCIRNWNDEME